MSRDGFEREITRDKGEPRGHDVGAKVLFGGVGFMDTPYKAAPDVWVLPSSLTLPGVGTLVVNAFVILADEPVLVDAGLALDSPEFVEQLWSIVPPEDLRWVWLTHDDADHTGSLQRVLEEAPQARLVTHALGAIRVSTWCPIDLNRVLALTPDLALDVGDRTLQALRPPLFDNPMTTGILDGRTGTLYSVDAFGAILPGAAQDVADFAESDLTQGMVGWATFDSPWTHLTDGAKYEEALDRLRRLAPNDILSSHLPPARGRIEPFLKILATVPSAEPFVPPDQPAFEAMIAGLG